MARIECNPFFINSSNQSLRNEQLFLLSSQLCAPRARRLAGCLVLNAT